MELDDFVEPEVGVAVAVTAAVATVVASPKVRHAARQGAVYGLAGLLIAGDRIAGMARSAARGAQNAAGSVRERMAHSAAEPADATTEAATS